MNTRRAEFDHDGIVTIRKRRYAIGPAFGYYQRVHLRREGGHEDSVAYAYGVGGVAVAQSLGPFSPTGSMTMPRAYHPATLLLDGRVLIAGGNVGDNGSTNIAELFDPSTVAFSPTGPMTRGRALHTATLLADGKVLIARGLFGNNASPKARRYTILPREHSLGIGDMTKARDSHTATLLPDERS